jgi:hypothetical protein
MQQANINIAVTLAKIIPRIHKGDENVATTFSHAEERKLRIFPRSEVVGEGSG